MDLAALLEDLHRLTHRHWVRKGLAAALSHSEFEYLRAIKDQESKQTDKDDHGQHLQHVVGAMGVKKASASAMVVKLEERGLVRRIPCRLDARAQHILLTKAGETLLKQGEAIYRAAADEWLSGQSASGRAAVLRLLAELDDET